MANIHNINLEIINNNNKIIKTKARSILVNGNGSKINNNNVGNLIIEIAGRIKTGNNKNEIRETLLKLGNFLKETNKNLKDKLLTKFGRYGNNKTTKITKRALAIAKRLKQINEKNEKIGNINGNNTEIGINNVKNNNTLPTRAQLLYYIIIYILKILNLKNTPPTSESSPPSTQGNSNWGSNFNNHIINVIEAIEKFRKEKKSSGLVKKIRGQVESARNIQKNDIENIKKLLNEMITKETSINVINIYEKIMNIFNKLNIKDKGSISGFIQNLYKKHCKSLENPRVHRLDIIIQRLKNIQSKAARAAVQTKNMQGG